MTRPGISSERFYQGMRFEQYLEYLGGAVNLSREGFWRRLPDGGGAGGPRSDQSHVFAERYSRARLNDHQTAAIRWLVEQPGGPRYLLAISEDWSSDCRRDVPWLARLAEAGSLEFRIFNRDGQNVLAQRHPDPLVLDANYDLMLELMNVKDGAEWASIPAVAVFDADFAELARYIEYPSIFHKDRIRAHQEAPRQGESRGQAMTRGRAEFAVVQASVFFDIWASAAIDQLLSALYERWLLAQI